MTVSNKHPSLGASRQVEGLRVKLSPAKHLRHQINLLTRKWKVNHYSRTHYFRSNHCPAYMQQFLEVRGNGLNVAALLGVMMPSIVSFGYNQSLLG